MKIALSLFLGVIGLGSIASANSGQFCNPQNQVVEYVCNETPRGQGWVHQNDGCYHRNTYQSCNAYNPGNPYPGNPPGDGWDRPGQKDLRNSMFQVRRNPNYFYADRYSQYCQFRNNWDADQFKRRYFPGRSVQIVRNIPYYLNYVGICNF